MAEIVELDTQPSAPANQSADNFDLARLRDFADKHGIRISIHGRNGEEAPTKPAVVSDATHDVPTATGSVERLSDANAVSESSATATNATATKKEKKTRRCEKHTRQNRTLEPNHQG